MAPHDRDEVWNVVNRKGDTVSIPGLEDWLCRKCTDKKPDDAMQYWVRKHLDTCRCGQKRPNKPFRFQKSLVSKATEAAKAAGTGRFAKAAPKAVPKVADTREVRDLQRQLPASEAEKARCGSSMMHTRHAGGRGGR